MNAWHGLPRPIEDDTATLPVQCAEPQHDNDRLRAFTEHGGEWVECLDCGRQWALHGDDIEQVSAGDGWCDAQDCS